MLFWLSVSLIPVLLLASLQAYLLARSSYVDRGEQLLVQSDRTLRSVANKINEAEVLLATYADAIAPDQCDRILETVREFVPFVTTVSSADMNRHILCSSQGNAGFTARISLPAPTAPYDNLSYRSALIYGRLSDQWVFVLSRYARDPDTDEPTGASHFSIGVAPLMEAVKSESQRDVDFALADIDGTILGNEHFAAINPVYLDRTRSRGRAQLFQMTGLDNKTYDVVVRPLEGENLFFIVTAPKPGLFSQSYWGPISFVLIPVSVFLIALIATWIAIQRMILRWMAHLQDLAIAYGEGLYTFKGQDFQAAPKEIRDLAIGLETMAGKIGERDADYRAAVATRDAAIAEVHHRIKNNLQIVTSFISLQSRTVANAEARQMLADIRHRMDALSIVHSTLYRYERIDTVNMPFFFDSLLRHLSEALGAEDMGVKIKWRVDEFDRSADDAIPMALLIVEIITNAIKYAFGEQEGGEVRIDLSYDGERAVLEVVDSGSGVSQEWLQSVRSGQHRGIGIRLMLAFSRQLGGDLQMENVAPPETGLRIKLVVPNRRQRKIVS
ncbi:sensor histidine kinase, putative [Parvularcula bermudensis HTCC2503]|uniref:histidine kinase n=1 Tax=Parvularcula bermudensis (strain ATCC BAA-594 / HTCC2503 / KCTC 12087) TaxID=314260 RepID=E0TFG1_PARBH|nr:sensor histidine kinase, putative [Parvularcula bermudensis HTCC2503]